MFLVSISSAHQYSISTRAIRFSQTLTLPTSSLTISNIDYPSSYHQPTLSSNDLDWNQIIASTSLVGVSRSRYFRNHTRFRFSLNPSPTHQILSHLIREFSKQRKPIAGICDMRREGDESERRSTSVPLIAPSRKEIPAYRYQSELRAKCTDRWVGGIEPNFVALGGGHPDFPCGRNTGYTGYTAPVLKQAAASHSSLQIYGNAMQYTWRHEEMCI